MDRSTIQDHVTWHRKNEQFKLNRSKNKTIPSDKPRTWYRKSEAKKEEGAKKWKRKLTVTATNYNELLYNYRPQEKQQVCFL